ncbi:MAG: polymer-forming cytoskeletal protein [Lachnospiraceae bacterium]|nr:polymer-forming cytoskeletal protein [Lachnospiraceae bacterium]
MGFFSDLKEDLSQAVNELIPEEELKADAADGAEGAAEAKADDVDLEKMLENIDSVVTDDSRKTDLAVNEDAGGETATEDFTAVETASEIALDDVVKEEEKVAEKENKENRGAEKKMDVNTEKAAVLDETSLITGAMTINGDIDSDGSLDIIGAVNGNVSILGKLNITGHVVGNSKAAEIFADGAKIEGEVVSEGAVKIGSSTVIVGNISATSAVIAGAVKGDIDVKGPVILDSSAIVMGNIKSKSVQINNGAVIEGRCSQCYADVNPTSFFDAYKTETKKK